MVEPIVHAEQIPSANCRPQNAPFCPDVSQAKSIAFRFDEFDMRDLIARVVNTNASHNIIDPG